MEDGPLGVCPARWTVDVSDNEWSTVFSLGGLTSVSPVAKEYEPREVNSDVLSFFPTPAKFDFQEIKIDKVVGVDEMMVEVTPSTIKVEPAERVQTTASVENADDTRLLWNPFFGS